MARKTRKVDWDKWIKDSIGSTDKEVWAREYLQRNAIQTYAEVTKRALGKHQQSQTELIAERLQQLEHAPKHTEEIRNMRLAWNSYIHRERSRQQKKKGYLFTMNIDIEPKLRGLAKPGESLSDTVERLITLGSDLEKELRKEKNQELAKIKEELIKKSDNKAKRHPLVKPKLDKTIASLKSEIELLSKQSEDNALIECRRQVLLQANDLLNTELTDEEEQRALSLYKKGR